MNNVELLKLVDAKLQTILKQKTNWGRNDLNVEWQMARMSILEQLVTENDRPAIHYPPGVRSAKAEHVAPTADYTPNPYRVTS